MTAALTRRWLLALYVGSAALVTLQQAVLGRSNNFRVFRSASLNLFAGRDLVGLSGFAHHYPHELSGGMQQRVNLARALVMDPKVLLMDEPFAALDAQTREVMQEELLQIWLQARKTVLFVTHQIDEAIYLADRVVVFSGRPGRVKDIIDVGIERPRKLGIKREPRFHAIEDRIWNLIEEDVKVKTKETVITGPPRGGETR